MTVAEQVQAGPERSQSVSSEQRIVLYGVDWPAYEKFLDAAATTRSIRLTYDRGTLEIMTVSGIHGWWNARIAFVLRLLGAVLGIDVQGYLTMTLRRQDVERGLEPDEGFYIRHQEVRGPRNIDLSRDPPPDLALEVDISRSSLDRMGIYSALRVPEVWRFDGEALRVYRLRADGTYEECERSPSFPSLPLAEFIQFLQQTQDLSDAGVIAPFQEWAREHVLPGWQAGGNGA